MLLAILNSVRPLNLMIIVLTQLLIYFFILIPVLQFMELTPSLNPFNFLLLCLSTVLIAAAGYIVNDVNDVEIDKINKPGKNKVGEELSRKSAEMFYYILTTLGIGIGVYLSIVLREQYLSLINVFCAGLLWVYALFLKRSVLAGNILVSLLTASCILIIIAFEPHSYDDKILVWIIGGYAYFAFLINLARELIKDMEDVEGDRAGYANTLAVKGGPIVTKVVVTLVLLVLMCSLGYLQYLQLSQKEIFVFMYLTFAIQLPLLLLIIFLWVFDSKKAYHRLGILTKGIMLSGILSILVFYKLFIQ